MSIDDLQDALEFLEVAHDYQVAASETTGE